MAGAWVAVDLKKKEAIVLVSQLLQSVVALVPLLE